MDDARSENNAALQMCVVGGHLDCLKYLREGFGLTDEDVRENENLPLIMAA